MNVPIAHTCNEDSLLANGTLKVRQSGVSLSNTLTALSSGDAVSGRGADRSGPSPVSDPGAIAMATNTINLAADKRDSTLSDEQKPLSTT